ncbi:hypothetical protein RB596_004891 [Gaeumannomyces avenae]
MTGNKPHQPPPPPPGSVVPPGGEDQRQIEGGPKDAATRVRDNQRASRARRRELLESLQRRVADYERQGAQATLEMQQAARTVAVENRRLRELLAAYGVPQAEVDEYARTGVSGNVPTEGALPTPPPESPLHFGRLSKQQQLVPIKHQIAPEAVLVPMNQQIAPAAVLAPMKQQIAPAAVLQPAPTSNCSTGCPPNRGGQTKKACKPQSTPAPQATPAPSCGPGTSSSCRGGKKNIRGPPRLDTTALPAITSAPPAAVAPSHVSEGAPQCGQAKPQQTCAPLTPCSSDHSATGSASPSDVVAIPPLMGSAVDAAAVPAAGQSGGIKRKLEEACPADLGGGSDSKRLNREQLAVLPADTVKTCSPSVRTPAKYVIPSDAPLEKKEELATIAPEPAACCGPKACGVPVTIELEPRHPSPPPLPQAVSCCSMLPSQAISCCGADADGPLQTRSVFQTACEDAAALLMKKRGENADATDHLEIRSALGCVGPGNCQVKYTTVLELLDKFTI